MMGQPGQLRFFAYALLLHGLLAMLLMLSPRPSLPEPDESAAIHAVMLAHIARPALPAPAPAMKPPKPVVAPPPATPPAPRHGATGQLHESTAASPRPADYKSNPVQGRKSRDQVNLHPHPHAGVAVDKAQAEQELQEIDAEAAHLSQSERQAAQDAAERAQAERLAAQRQAQQNQALINSYKQRIIAIIHQHWQEPLCARPDMFIVLRLQLLPDGSVVSVIPLQNNACLNLSVQSAIGSIDRLPVPSDPLVFESNFRSFKLRFTPNDTP